MTQTTQTTVDPALQSAWDALQATPSYVERDLSEVKPLLLTAAYGPSHTLSAPFCADERCGCHKDDRLFDEYILEPMMAGLLTSYEANRLMWPE